ncbi:quinate pathway repressor protein QutR [Marssonina coronariae]|uniref:Quinate pathway repressor protein QutR n=1 Tax=Diplocarpon coronariae TaxID=2795749 RepID=A0A218YXA7_9HELO|nr:quinate pathway repressor protein QutR [Marssonina coronariae]
MSVITQLETPAYLDSTTRPRPNVRDFPSNASIVLVGSRGSGKRTLGFIGATHLGRRLITEDYYFQEVTGVSRGVFMQQHGSLEFYQKNVEVLKRMLDNHRSGCVIECGMGSLPGASQKALYEYCKTNPVIYVTRESERIKSLLRLGDEEATRLEKADLAHRNCSNLEYFNLYDDSSSDGTDTPPENGLGNVSSRLKYAKEDFSKFLDSLTGQGIIRSGLESPFSVAALPAEFRSYTYALSLRLSVIPDLDLADLEAGADAVQLKIDTWSPNLQKLIGKQVATIRRSLEVPIIFQVEDYAFDDAHLSLQDKEHAYFMLMEYGLRLGVEYIVVDLKYSSDRFSHIVRSSGRTKVIGYHMHGEENSWGWDDESRMIQYRRAKSLGCNIVRFVRTTSKASDNDTVRQFVKKIESMPDGLPVIAYNIGENGRPSLVANRIFTPVTHPVMQSTVTSLEDIQHLCQNSSFGGAAITQPFKVEILSRIAAKSYHAKAIGAVNTLLPLRILSHTTLDGSTQSLLRHANQRGKAGPIIAYYGDNTDFIGIMTSIRRNLSPRNVIQPSKTTGLVIGAGGMARAAIYAMIQLGCRKIFIYNRTLDNAETVARHFNSWASGLSSDGEIVRVLKSGGEDWPADFRQPTMIISCVPARQIGTSAPANFEMPIQWLGSPTGGVVVELAYFPLDTPLLKQIRQVREETKQSWVIVDGLEVLPEQASAQFELMTGRRAPRRRMRLEVMKNYHRYVDSTA